MDRLPAGRGRRSVSTSKRALPVCCVSRPSLAIHSSGLVNHGTSRSLRRRSGTSALLSSPIEFDNEKSTSNNDYDDCVDVYIYDMSSYDNSDGDELGRVKGKKVCRFIE